MCAPPTTSRRSVLMLVAVSHLIALGYKVFVLRRPLTMLPSLQDVKDAWTAFAYNIGLGKSRPQMSRYTFEEKAEYWALVWGILIMGLTGFMMWNPLGDRQALAGRIHPGRQGRARRRSLAGCAGHHRLAHVRRASQTVQQVHVDRAG